MASPSGSSRRSSSLRHRLRAWVADSTRGKTWWIRTPLVAFLSWIGWQHLHDRWYSSLFDGMNLVFHEMGHVFFGFFGSRFLTVAGGTVFELAVPLAAAALLARERDAFGVSVGVFWFGDALQSVSQYVADTRAQRFGRVSIGDGGGPDDWTYLLSKFELIRQDVLIGSWVRGVGLVVMAAALVYGVWVLRLMARKGGGGHEGEGFEESERPARRFGSRSP